MTVAIVYSRTLTGMHAPLMRQPSKFRVIDCMSTSLPASSACPESCAPIRGALAMTPQAKDDRRAFILPTASAAEAALVREAVIYPACSLLAVCAHLKGRELLMRQGVTAPSVASELYADISDIKGQGHAKRALEIVAAGRHSLLMM